MNGWRALSLLPFAFICSNGAHATKIACIGTNGERLLSWASLSAAKSGGAAIESALNSLAKQTGSDLDRSEIFESTSGAEAVEFRLTSASGTVEITVEQDRKSGQLTVRAMRTCSSASSNGWELLWRRTLLTLRQRGYRPTES